MQWLELLISPMSRLSQLHVQQKNVGDRVYLPWKLQDILLKVFLCEACYSNLDPAGRKTQLEMLIQD